MAASETPRDLWPCEDEEDIEEEIVAPPEKKAASLAKGVRARLTELRSKILDAHESVEDAAVEGLRNARAAGEALIEAKGLCQHGEWLPFLKECHESLTERTAQAYMQVAKHWARLSLSKAQRVADLSFRGALKILAEYRNGEKKRAQPEAERRLDAMAPPDQFVREVNTSLADLPARDEDEYTKREARRANVHALALRVIESGKVEARKAHPDAGGSTEDMQMLTDARDALLECYRVVW